MKKGIIIIIINIFYTIRFGPYFVTPIVAGLEDGVPILATYDSIGCMSNLDDF